MQVNSIQEYDTLLYHSIWILTAPCEGFMIEEKGLVLKTKNVALSSVVCRIYDRSIVPGAVLFFCIALTTTGKITELAGKMFQL